MSIQQKMFSELKEKEIFKKAVSMGTDYINRVNDRNVYPTEQALNDLKIFEESMPEDQTDVNKILNDLDKYGSPATVAQAGRRYFGFVCGSVVPAGLAAKILASFWDQNSSMFVLSPIAAKLEMVVEKWMVSLLGLPEGTAAGFVSGTSVANICGLAAARYKLLNDLGWDINKKGFSDSPKLRIVAGRQAHSTVLRAIGLLGFGSDNTEYVDCDDNGRIVPELIPELDNRSILILQAGNVNGGSFDDFEKICTKAKKEGAWIHIDGAFGLWVAACNQTSHYTKGIELADSWALDGHKTLNTPYDNGIVLCRNREAIVNALHMSAGYIVLSDHREGMFYTPEMSRRARIVELWATLKYLGKKGIDEMISGMLERTKQFERELSEVKGFKILNEVVFNQLVVACENDELTEKVLKNIQEDRVCWVGGSVWQGRKVIRVSVCSWATTEEDVSMSVRLFADARR